MNGLREKFRNKKGFTLIEMLIVVAIIAILIAVSIPLVGSALETARDNTDLANERAAKAEALLYYLGTVSDTDYKNNVNEDATKGGFNAFYDAKQGTLAKTAPTEGYGQCTQTHEDSTSYGSTAQGPHTDKVIKVVVSKDGTVNITWEAKAAAAAPGP